MSRNCHILESSLNTTRNTQILPAACFGCVRLRRRHSHCRTLSGRNIAHSAPWMHISDVSILHIYTAEFNIRAFKYYCTYPLWRASHPYPYFKTIIIYMIINIMERCCWCNISNPLCNANIFCL